MDAVASASSEVYRAFVGQAGFMDYFRTATPIDVIERMTLGSRPSRRLGQDAALGNLRAIPWVFAWSQARAVIPGWYGVGSGLQAAVDAGHEQTLREMARDWPFFRTFLDDIAMVLSKGDITIAEQFSLLSGDLHALLPAGAARTGTHPALAAGADGPADAARPRCAAGAVDPPAQSLRRSDQRAAGGPAAALAGQRARG
jgi:hypothetical protein